MVLTTAPPKVLGSRIKSCFALGVALDSDIHGLQDVLQMEFVARAKGEATFSPFFVKYINKISTELDEVTTSCGQVNSQFSSWWNGVRQDIQNDKIEAAQTALGIWRLTLSDPKKVFQPTG